MAREGSLEAPTRHPIAWKEDDFYNKEMLDQELRRVFDICHGCRRCFNLCDSFPKLFDVIDDSETGELDSVTSDTFQPVVDSCTLCDMCFMTKCPYVPPHEFNLDFPHLMLRYRAVEHKDKVIPLATQQLTKTDRNGKLGCSVSKLANWATSNNTMRSVAEKTLGVDKHASLPVFANTPYAQEVARQQSQRNLEAPAATRKAVIYTTCSANYNNPSIARSALAVLEKNGIDIEWLYPECCGMPQLEHGDIGQVADKAQRIAATLEPWIDKGYDVISLVPSCTLMLKFEWLLIEPDNKQIQKLSQATRDITEYLVHIAKTEGLVPGLQPLDGEVTVHIACHARAQNQGQKAAELLRLLPDTTIHVIERCSGHGGSWGVMKGNFETALKVGKPVFKKAARLNSRYMVSECPLARDHIAQGLEQHVAESLPQSFQHPIELIALAYGEGA